MPHQTTPMHPLFKICSRKINLCTPAPFEQAMSWLLVIDGSRLMRPAVCLGEEHGLISRAAADNWAYNRHFDVQLYVCLQHKNCEMHDRCCSSKLITLSQLQPFQCYAFSLELLNDHSCILFLCKNCHYQDIKMYVQLCAQEGSDTVGGLSSIGSLISQLADGYKSSLNYFWMAHL